MSNATLLVLVFLLCPQYIMCIAADAASFSGTGNTSWDKHLRGAVDPIGKERLLQSSYVDPFWWQDYKVARDKTFKRCKFQKNVAPTSGTDCRKMKVGDFTCMFDDQTCPDGSTHPAIACDCKDRTWNCAAFEACPDVVVECPVDPLGPDIPPKDGDRCVLQPHQSCYYGRTYW